MTPPILWQPSAALVERAAITRYMRSLGRGAPWLLMPIMILVGMSMVAFVRPDPKEIGAHLDRYYPGLPPPSRPALRCSGSR